MHMNANPVRIAINGAAGRMGRQLLSAIAERNQASLVGAIDAPGSEAIGCDTSILSGGDKQGISVVDSVTTLTASTDIDVIIDFTAPGVTLKMLEQLEGNDVAVVIGTTGFDDAQLATLYRLPCCSRLPRHLATIMM